MNVGEAVRLQRLEGGWCYVISEATEGYMREEGVFVCTQRHYERYRKLLGREYQVVLKSGRCRDGQYFRVGTVLPVFDNEPEGTEQDGGPIFVRSYLPFTERQLRLQAERMTEIPYSWGDERLDGLDCSSTVRAFYACFGITLPRNSEMQQRYGEQGAVTGKTKYVDLTGKSSEDKAGQIRLLGVGAVLHMPGHVMIYMGEKEGSPRIFHNCDTYTEDGTEHIVRKSIISKFLPKGEDTYLDYVTAAWRPEPEMFKEKQ